MQISCFSNSLFPESRYYNLYETNNPQTACGGKVCKGHSDTARWYNNDFTFSGPWVYRGGGYDNGNSGVFDFYFSDGGSSKCFRIVITNE